MNATVPLFNCFWLTQARWVILLSVGLIATSNGNSRVEGSEGPSTSRVYLAVPTCSPSEGRFAVLCVRIDATDKEEDPAAEAPAANDSTVVRLFYRSSVLEVGSTPWAIAPGRPGSAEWHAAVEQNAMRVVERNLGKRPMASRIQAVATRLMVRVETERLCSGNQAVLQPLFAKYAESAWVNVDTAHILMSATVGDENERGEYIRESLARALGISDPASKEGDVGSFLAGALAQHGVKFSRVEYLARYNLFFIEADITFQSLVETLFARAGVP